MKWSPQQDTALQSVAKWMREGKTPVFRMFGYAGTGKTTLAKHFATGIDGRILFAAYTGKAAAVMRSSGCLGATTIHSLVYRPVDKSSLRLRELERLLLETSPKDLKEILRLNREIEAEKKSLKEPAFRLDPDSEVRDAALLILDECSMINAAMAEDLLSYNTPILVLGDPAQLPPVKGGGAFTSEKPDIMLTEIHRQAQNNPVLRIANQVRKGEPVKRGVYEGGDGQFVRVISRKEHIDWNPKTYDQILVGRNLTRKAGNRQMRKMLGHQESIPEPGEKLVCLRNDHKVGLLNGELWTVVQAAPLGNTTLVMTLVPDGESTPELTVEAHRHYFDGNEDGLTYWERRNAQEFDFGYVLTVHKAQGSQWDRILINDESWAFRTKAMATSWMYTALTRASKSAIILKNS